MVLSGAITVDLSELACQTDINNGILMTDLSALSIVNHITVSIASRASNSSPMAARHSGDFSAWE